MYRLKTNFGTCGLHREDVYHRNSVVAPLNRLSQRVGRFEELLFFSRWVAGLRSARS